MKVQGGDFVTAFVDYELGIVEIAPEGGFKIISFVKKGRKTGCP